MSDDNHGVSMFDRALLGLNAYLEAHKNVEGPLPVPPNPDGTPDLTNGASSLYSRDTFYLMQLAHGSCWMNVGHKSVKEYPKSAETLFLSMFEGQENEYLKRKPLSILDTSSAYGDQYLALNRVLGDISYVGINPDQDQTLMAARRTNFRVPFFTLSAGNIGMFPHDAYDMVLSHENAVHFKSRKLYLTNVHRVLKPGGMFFSHDLLRAGRLLQGRGLHTIEEYGAFAESVGFEVVTLRDISDQILLRNMNAVYSMMGLDTIEVSGGGEFFFVRVQLRKKGGNR